MLRVYVLNLHGMSRCVQMRSLTAASQLRNVRSTAHTVEACFKECTLKAMTCARDTLACSKSYEQRGAGDDGHQF